MASEPDDNPFARNSAWPKMPQAPFKVGPLPKGAPSPTGSVEPAAAPLTTITPAFVRPVNAPTFAGLSGGAVPRAAPRPAPPAMAPDSAVVIAPAASAVTRESVPPPPEAPASYVELAPVIVQPLGSGVRKAHRKSPVPAIAITAAGLAAVLGIAYALNRGQEASLKTAAPAAVATAAPVTPPPAAASLPAPTPAVVADPARPTPSKAASRPASGPKRVALPTAPVAAAAPPPVLALPPAPVAAPPAQEPLQDYTPPAAPDANAPMSNRRRD